MNWQFITFFGDSTLLLPSALLVFIMLQLFAENRSVAWQWAGVFGATGAIVCASKLAFMGWGLGIRSLNFTCFSGHTALSSCFWPVLMWLIGGRFSVVARRLMVVGGFALAVLVGVSRLMVNAHSPSEVIAGMALGFCASITFLLLQRQTTAARLSWGKLAIALGVPLILLNTGAKAPTQSLLGEIAVLIGPASKPFTRQDLLAGNTPWQ